MRHIAILLFICIAFAANAQLEFGIKAGLSSQNLTDKKLLIPGNDTDLELAIHKANYGFHFGMYSRLSLLTLFIEPAVLFNSSSVEYNLSETIFDQGVVNTIRSETYNNIDIPVMVGWKLAFANVHAGPVAHILLNSSSELTAIGDYDKKFRDATFGYQLGIGFNILKVRIDFNYEGNLSKFGNHISIGGSEFNFDDRPERFVASIGFRF